MFPFGQSPCVYERQPAYETFAPFAIVPGNKKRRVCQQSPHRASLPRGRDSVNFDITEENDQYVVSIYKQVSENLLSDAVCRYLQKLKETRAPTYHVVRDFFGNEYYVEDEQDEAAFVREAMANLDMASIQRQAAKNSFKDYEIILNHRGDELVLSSRRDNIYKEFALGVEFEDICVNGFEMVSENVAALRIGIKKPIQKAAILPLESRMIGCDNATRKAVVLRDESAQREAAERKAAERKAAEREVAQREAAQRKVAEEEAAHRMLVLQQEVAHREAVMREAKRLQEEALKAAEETRARELHMQKKAEKAAKKAADHAAKNKRKHAIAEKKAFLIEEKKKRRDEEAREMSASSNTHTPSRSSSASPVVININFAAPTGSEPQVPQKQVSQQLQKTRGRSHSPVLEDVDDEEVDRYRKSFERSPRGSSIIDNP
ncbi:LANO_0D02146g1_1 [Lachancea nothofagi CBS 11611]|uniref:LANO_0D02146g1_1 n=1 Tax=Lachancea nothofagi CBS 11611 TaxID=1266666 RepID=A0A1G4JE08_9SACH|nr:LANO_0D02146g1_1 [Lachancea nothofagi CBS 11611]